MARTWQMGEGRSAGMALRQRIEQRVCLLRICRVEPFGEPGVNKGKQLTRFGLLALLLAEANGGPQLN